MLLPQYSCRVSLCYRQWTGSQWVHALSAAGSQVLVNVEHGGKMVASKPECEIPSFQEEKGSQIFETHARWLITGICSKGVRWRMARRLVGPRKPGRKYARLDLFLRVPKD